MIHNIYMIIYIYLYTAYRHIYHNEIHILKLFMYDLIWVRHKQFIKKYNINYTYMV